MNKNELRSVMAKYGHTNKNLAELLGLSEQSVSAKINEKKSAKGKPAEFTQGEIAAIAERYNLTAEQIKVIFFN